MKLNKITLAAIALWLATIATLAWFFVHGNTAAGTDGRTAIVLQANERALILAKMRGLLLATHDILDGLDRGDLKQVAQAAHAAGMASAADVNPALMAKLPLSFKQLGMSVHRDMDDIARAADHGAAPGEIMKMLTGTLSSCVACHGSWQLQAGNRAI
jgi:hypothetical protein